MFKSIVHDAYLSLNGKMNIFTTLSMVSLSLQLKGMVTVEIFIMKHWKNLNLDLENLLLQLK